MPRPQKGTVSGEILGVGGGLFDEDDGIILGKSTEQFHHSLSVDSFTGRTVSPEIDDCIVVLGLFDTEESVRASFVGVDNDSTLIVMLYPLI